MCFPYVSTYVGVYEAVVLVTEFEVRSDKGFNCTINITQEIFRFLKLRRILKPFALTETSIGSDDHPVIDAGIKTVRL